MKKKMIMILNILSAQYTAHTLYIPNLHQLILGGKSFFIANQRIKLYLGTAFLKRKIRTQGTLLPFNLN